MNLPQRLRSDELRPRRVGPRDEELSERARGLLDAVEAIIIDEGLSWTMTELATRLRCSLRTLYELAPSRDGLILLVYDRRFRRLGAVVRDELAQTADPMERLRIALATGPMVMRPASLQFREDVNRHPGVQLLVACHYRHAVAVVEEMIEEGIAAGVFRPINARVAAEIVRGAFMRFIDPEMLRETGLTGEQCMLELLSILESALVIPGVVSQRRRRGKEK